MSDQPAATISAQINAVTRERDELRAAAQRILDALDDGVPTQEEIEELRAALARHKNY